MVKTCNAKRHIDVKEAADVFLLLVLDWLSPNKNKVRTITCILTDIYEYREYFFELELSWSRFSKNMRDT